MTIHKKARERKKKGQKKENLKLFFNESLRDSNDLKLSCFDLDIPSTCPHLLLTFLKELET